MVPNFNESKTTQLACLLLKKRGGKMSFLKLIKLMYLVDRTALLRWGWSMTFDKYVSMNNGCVLSRTYDLIREESIGDSYWKRFISEPMKYEVSLLAEPELDEISKAEMELVDEVYGQFGHLNRWQLVNYTHELPEWTNPKGSSLPIDYKDVLKAGGKSEQEVFEIIDDLEQIALFETTVSS